MKFALFAAIATIGTVLAYTEQDVVDLENNVDLPGGTGGHEGDGVILFPVDGVNPPTQPALVTSWVTGLAGFILAALELAPVRTFACDTFLTQSDANMCQEAIDYCSNERIGFLYDIGMGYVATKKFRKAGQQDGSVRPCSTGSCGFRGVDGDTVEDALIHAMNTAMIANYANCDIGLYCYPEDTAQQKANEWMDSREDCNDGSLLARAAAFMDHNNNRVGAETWRSLGNKNFFGLWQEPKKSYVWNTLRRKRTSAVFYDYEEEGDTALEALLQHEYNGKYIYFRGQGYDAIVTPSCPPGCSNDADCAPCPGTSPTCQFSYQRLRRLLRDPYGPQGGRCVDAIDDGNVVIN